jgi:hypothetical protein
MSISLSVTGGPRIAAALDPQTLTGPAVEKLVDIAAERSHQLARDRAPNKTGRLEASIRRQASGSRLTRTGKLTNDVTNKGFRYGWALETSKRRVYRYRSSGPAGESTRGWFSRVARLVVDRLAADAARADSDIARWWASI